MTPISPTDHIHAYRLAAARKTGARWLVCSTVAVGAVVLAVLMIG